MRNTMEQEIYFVHLCKTTQSNACYISYNALNLRKCFLLCEITIIVTKMRARGLTQKTVSFSVALKVKGNLRNNSI